MSEVCHGQGMFVCDMLYNVLLYTRRIVLQTLPEKPATTGYTGETNGYILKKKKQQKQRQVKNDGIKLMGIYV